MYTTIRISNPNTWLVPRKKVDGDWIAHVSCDGARFHVLSWDTFGTRCSEKMCIINKARKERIENDSRFRTRHK